MKVLTIALLLSLPVAAGAQEGARTRRVTVAPDGEPANSGGFFCDVARDGAAVAFDSYASNLVDDDTNGKPDVFVWDPSGAITRVSVTSDGRQSDSYVQLPRISGNGRFVVFWSSTPDLGDHGEGRRLNTVFVHDRLTGETTPASVRSDGGRPNDDSGSASISNSGRYVAFVSRATNLTAKGDGNRFSDVFVHDRRTGKTNRVSLTRKLGAPNSDSDQPAISGNGRFVAYDSYASNIVRGDDNDSPDVFVYDRVERTTDLVSLRSDGRRSTAYSVGPSISRNGRFVSFSTDAVLASTDTASGRDVYVRDRATGVTEQVSLDTEDRPLNQESAWSSISDDGRYVAFATLADNPGSGDTNELMDVYVRDREAGTTTRVSVGSEGEESNGNARPWPSLSPDGGWVCWLSPATNLDDKPHPGDFDDVFLRGPLSF